MSWLDVVGGGAGEQGVCCVAVWCRASPPFHGSARLMRVGVTLLLRQGCSDSRLIVRLACPDHNSNIIIKWLIYVGPIVSSGHKIATGDRPRVDLKASRQQGQAEDSTGHRRHGEPLVHVQVRHAGRHDVGESTGLLWRGWVECVG